MYKLIIKVTNKIIIYSVCQESSVDISLSMLQDLDQLLIRPIKEKCKKYCILDN